MGVEQDPLGVAAEDELADRRAAAQADDDQLGLVGLGDADQVLGGLEAAHQLPDLVLDAGPVEPERLRAGLDRALAQSGRLARLLDHLLDLSRATAGRLVLEREEVELGGLAEEVTARLGAQLAKAGCPVRVRTAGPVRGHWDRIRIEQVLTNLLGNVSRHAPGAPVEIEVGAADGRAQLRVRDHGPGIAPEVQPRIFKPYPRSAEPGKEGLGLGLYITKQIADAHGGSIAVESEPGRGATFTVELPLGGPAPG